MKSSQNLLINCNHGANLSVCPLLGSFWNVIVWLSYKLPSIFLNMFRNELIKANSNLILLFVDRLFPPFVDKFCFVPFQRLISTDKSNSKTASDFCSFLQILFLSIFYLSTLLIFTICGHFFVWNPLISLHYAFLLTVYYLIIHRYWAAKFLTFLPTFTNISLKTSSEPQYWKKTSSIKFSESKLKSEINFGSGGVLVIVALDAVADALSVMLAVSFVWFHVKETFSICFALSKTHTKPIEWHEEKNDNFQMSAPNAPINLLLAKGADFFGRKTYWIGKTLNFIKKLFVYIDEIIICIVIRIRSNLENSPIDLFESV